MAETPIVEQVAAIIADWYYGGPQTKANKVVALVGEHIAQQIEADPRIAAYIHGRKPKMVQGRAARIAREVGKP